MTAGDSVKRHRNIVALVGSLRRDSYNRMLFNAALELAPPEMTITELTGWQQWPLLNLDEVADGMLEPVTQMARQITESDGVLFVSPEYNYSIPAGSKEHDRLAIPSRPATICGQGGWPDGRRDGSRWHGANAVPTAPNPGVPRWSSDQQT